MFSRTWHDLRIFAEDTDFLMAPSPRERGPAQPLPSCWSAKLEPQTEEKVSVTQAAWMRLPKKLHPSEGVSSTAAAIPAG